MSKEINAKSLNAQTDIIIKSIGAMRKMIQTHIVDMARFTLVVDKDSNVSPLTRFIVKVESLSGDGKSESVIRTEPVVRWLERFAFVTWAKNDKGIYGFKISKANRKARDTFVALSAKEQSDHFKVAASTRWNETVKAEKVESLFDLSTVLESALKRGLEHQGKSFVAKDGTVKYHKVDENMLKLLDNLVHSGVGQEAIH